MRDTKELSDPVEVIIKGEIHTSRGDLREERDILAEGVDTLIIEGQKEEADFGILHGWFGVAMIIFNYLFARFMYTDHGVLVDTAKGQNADVVYTRESDIDLLFNSHTLVIGFAFTVFYGCLAGSAILGLLGDTANGTALLVASGVAPVLILRGYETWKSDDNRDQIIAEKIENAVEDGGRVVAVMGEAHARNVPDYLSDDIDPDVRGPRYGMVSRQMALDLAFPVVALFGMLTVVYPVYLFIAEVALALAG